MSYFEVNYPMIYLTDAREALLCARLNLRRARRLLQKASFKRGVVALYDSVLFGMHYYMARHESLANVDLTDAALSFHRLARLGIFEDHHAFNRLTLIVERALWQGFIPSDPNALLIEVEEMLTRLGVTDRKKSSTTMKSGRLH